MNDQRPTGKPITLAEVAKRADVSQMTASKVMRNTGSISPATRERVRKAVVELGYVPNRFAGALSSKTSDIVAVVLPSINDTIFGDVISGVNDVLRPKGYITFIGESNFDGLAEEEILRTVLSLHPAGIIITGGINRTQRAQKMVQSWNCPTIQIWDDEESGFDGSVAPSHSEAGRLIAQHFLEQGYRCPAYIGAELSKDICAGRRFEAFQQTLIANTLVPEEMIREDLPRQSETGRILVKELMNIAPATDAIYCLNDAIALGALSWLHENNYTVPSEIGVAGFNGTSTVNAVRTRLTTVHVERYNLGKIAAEAILGLLDGKSVDHSVRLEPKLIVGNTT